MLPDPELTLSARISRSRPMSAAMHEELVDVFRVSDVGVFVVGLPLGTPVGTFKTEDLPSLSLGTTLHPDGKSRILAFADPLAFIEKYGAQCNGSLPGQHILDTVLHSPDCDGILLNSAESEDSVCIDRSHIERLRNTGAVVTRRTTKMRWWPFKRRRP